MRLAREAPTCRQRFGDFLNSDAEIVGSGSTSGRRCLLQGLRLHPRPGIAGFELRNAVRRGRCGSD